jgi:hypothetical protein
MAFQPVTHGIKIEMNATQNSIPVVNVWYVQMASTVTDADLENVADAVYAWYGASLQAGLHQSYVLDSIITTDVSTASGHQFNLPVTSGGGGGDTGDPAAANAAVCISWRTANTGRSFRGRTFIGGLPQGALIDAQHIATGSVSYYATAAQDLIDALLAVNAVLVVVSRFAAGVARITALATEIISIIVDNKVDSQRRRTAN